MDPINFGRLQTFYENLLRALDISRFRGQVHNCPCEDCNFVMGGNLWTQFDSDSKILFFWGFLAMLVLQFGSNALFVFLPMVPKGSVNNKLFMNILNGSMKVF